MKFKYISNKVSPSIIIKALSVTSYKATLLFYSDMVCESRKAGLLKVFEGQAVIEERLEAEFGLNPGVAEGLLTMMPNEKAVRRLLEDQFFKEICNNPDTQVTLIMSYETRVRYCKLDYKNSSITLKVTAPPIPEGLPIG